ncbi:homoserine dehydrogenase [Desulfotalea psychrophila]|uniref:Homoserine dehydrogenase n=1 Tax=Desulfotalea psychrophila (strain LSv54 / DSM 12343) TaxID=177439 RepID=Q6AMG4_DESPS|nr:homoserine dehydrogenase [Desulfotalea psychrophila]CAG36461.1 probable homoserine dehydrogenase [Desulfotalea psychrophila LSv54]
MKEICVGIIGFGTVGRGLAETLRIQQERLEARIGATIRLKTVADIACKSLPEEFAGVTLTQNATDIFTDPEIDIVVELIGGIEPAKTFLLQAIENGKHVITANKALLSTHGKEIFEAAVAKNVEVGFEASVGGGIPVIKALKEGLVANRINSIKGIMNGTANYILSQMTEHGTPFAEVLKEAQELGFAEADPTYDVEGVDTAHKLAILMTIAYGLNVNIDHINIEGISSIEPVDIDIAREFGFAIKLLAISNNHGDNVEARVHPTMVPHSHMLATIGGAFNGIHFNGDTVTDVLLYGPGAGMMPTGSAVAADVADIARNILSDSVNRVPALSYQPERMTAPVITPMSELVCAYYFRFTVSSEPGVLAAIATILGKYNISVQSIVQKELGEDQPVYLVVRSHDAQESAVNAAMAEIRVLDACLAEPLKIRILGAND